MTNHREVPERPWIAAGLMSGTSADGIDVALVELSGAPPQVGVRLLLHRTYAYDPALRAELFACFRPESSSVDRLCRLNTALGEAYAEAILRAIGEADLTPEAVDLVGSHGQTMWYEPPDRSGGPEAVRRGAVLTFGDPSTIAERTGITTVGQFRERDLAAGGNGAPLVSYMDWLLFRHASRTRAIQNIGGIGNVTALPPLTRTSDGPELLPITFDTGPGNMLIDYCANRATDGALAYDEDGQIAARGTVDSGWLAELMRHPYLHQPPPKTTGREAFGVQFGAEIWAAGQTRGLSPADIVATVTAFTAESIAAAYREWIPYPVEEIYLAGGGAQNPTLCAMIQARVAPAAVYPHESLGMPGAAKEAVLFALLAYETWHGRAGSLPVFTGASRPVPLGVIVPGRTTHASSRPAASS